MKLLNKKSYGLKEGLLGALYSFDAIYLILILFWIVRAYTGVDLVTYGAGVFLLLRILIFFRFKSFISYSLPFLFIAVIFGLYEYIVFGSLRPYMTEGLFLFSIFSISLSTLGKLGGYSNLQMAFVRLPDWYSSVECRVYVFTVVAISTLILINYLIPSVHQSEFLYSNYYTGRWAPGDSSNPIWLVFIAALAVGLSFISKFFTLIFIGLLWFSYFASGNLSTVFLVGFVLVLHALAFRKVLTTLPFLFIMVLVLSVAFLPDLFEHLIKDESASQRVTNFKSALDRFSLWGAGSSSFYVDIPLVDLAFEYGIFGLICIVAILSFYMYVFIFAIKGSRLSPFVPLISSISVFFVAQFYYRPFELPYLISFFSFIFWSFHLLNYPYIRSNR